MPLMHETTPATHLGALKQWRYDQRHNRHHIN